MQKASRKELATALKEVIAETHVSEVDILVAYDSSGSVKESEFKIAKDAGSLCIEQFGKLTHVGLIKFSSVCDVESPLSSDLRQVLHINNEINKKNGETRTDLAFEKAKEIFQKGRQNAKKYLLLFTDGDPDDELETKRKFSDLKKLKVEVFGIGIGKVILSRLQEISNQAYFLPTYESLLEAIPSVSTIPPASIPASLIEISIRVEFPDPPIALTDPLVLKIEIQNLRNTEIPANSLLKIHGGDFYSENVKKIESPFLPGDKKIVEIELRPEQHAHVNMVPESIQIFLEHPILGRHYLAKKAQFPLTLYHLTASLSNWSSPKLTSPKANILLFGGSGAGKSALINAIFTMLSKNYENPAVSLRSGQQVTKHFIPYHKHSFCLIDSIGFVEQNLQEAIPLAQVLTGDYSFGSTVTSEDSPNNSNQEARQKKKIHSCIIVLTQGMRGQLKGNDAVLQGMRSYVNDIAAAQITPILVVTGLDLASDNKETIVQEFSALTTINKSDIFVVDNSHPEKKEMKNEKVLYSILTLALQSAGNFIHKNAQLYPPALVSRGRRASTFGTFEYFTVHDKSNESEWDIYTKEKLTLDHYLSQLRILINQHPNPNRISNPSASSTSSTSISSSITTTTANPSFDFDFYNVNTNRLVDRGVEDRAPISAAADTTIQPEVPTIYIKSKK